VVSHVRLARDAKTIAAQRIPAGGTDLLLATDLVVAASPEARQMIAAARTRAVIDTHVTPVASFIRGALVILGSDQLERALHAIQQAGLRVPDDVSIVDLFDVPAAWEHPRFMSAPGYPPYEVAKVS